MLDARDPLRYRSEDLENYASQMQPSKPSLLLLNKADLLPAPLRSAWADYFEQQHVDYVFWSAKAGIDALTAGTPHCILLEHFTGPEYELGVVAIFLHAVCAAHSGVVSLSC